ncbi:MAG: hypothetical protein FWC27_14215 [Firmicutes bacterium]|nr:hypothetical protein [Bacillota bacterium]
MQREQFGPWEIEYDREATRAAYARMEPYGCTCRGCRNYLANIPSFPEEVLLFFERLGVSPEKPTEVLGGNHGIFHLAGKYISGEDIWQTVPKDYQGSFEELEAHCRAHAPQWIPVADDFDVGFTRSIDLQPEAISPEQTLQMEISFRLPWLLDEPCT